MFKKYRYKIIHSPRYDSYNVYKDMGFITYDWYLRDIFPTKKEAEVYINKVKEEPKEWYYS